MATYKIENTRSGLVLGEYEGTSEADALDTMARDAGYTDYAACCAVAPVADGEIVVTLVDANDGAWSSWGVKQPTPEEIAALKAQDDARDAEKLAEMGLTRGQPVTWDGEAWTIVCAMGDGRVMLHNATGFASDGAAIPVASLTRR